MATGRQMAAISPQLWHFVASLLSSKYAADDILDVNISDLNEIDDLEASDSQDFVGMIQELIKDKPEPTWEAQKISKEIEWCDHHLNVTCWAEKK